MSEVPYTSARSDFLKLVGFDDSKKDSLIDYAATDFATLRTALINYMKAVYPLDYQNFSESDFGLMFTELVSYMGAILSMKADMLAHESFIATAKDRNNVKKLLELIGIRLKGPAAAASLAQVIGPGIGDAESHIISAEQRVLSVTSAEDNAPVNYTLYTITNGTIDNPEQDSSITLLASLSDNAGAGNTVWSNVALVEGAFARETGIFNDLEVLKEVVLENGPVIENSVQVFIDSGNSDTSGPYTEVESLYSASSSEQKIFSVVYTDDYNAKIVFGDGSNGAIPPTNSTYVITYRVGGGSRGNAPKSYINQTVTATDTNLLLVENIEKLTGGSEAETVDKAKKYGPLFFKTQSRLVTLDDYKVFASRFVGPIGTSAKATASTRKGFSSANIIDVYILEKASNLQLQKASINFKTALLSSIKNQKMLTDEIILVDGLIRTLDLVMTISIDEKYKPKESEIIRLAAAAVIAFFNVDNRDYGETLVLEDINRAVFNNVNEVRISKIDNLTDNINLEFNEIAQLNNVTINTQFV